MSSASLIWKLDDALRLQPADRLPSAVTRCVMPERAIDTVLLRNLDVACKSLFGRAGKFLFNSLQYWGAFDVGAVLTDGQVVCIESKKRRASVGDFRKFLRDVKAVHEEDILYLSHRWQHHMDYWDIYNAASLCMFAAFFLQVRCETSKANLPRKAADQLGISLKELRKRHDANNEWLSGMKAMTRHHEECVGLYEYLQVYKLKLLREPPLWVLLAPNTDLDQIKSWRPESPTPLGQRALLINYDFWSVDRSYPTYLTVEPGVEFHV